MYDWNEDEALDHAMREEGDSVAGAALICIALIAVTVLLTLWYFWPKCGM